MNEPSNVQQATTKYHHEIKNCVTFASSSESPINNPADKTSHQNSASSPVEFQPEDHVILEQATNNDQYETGHCSISASSSEGFINNSAGETSHQNSASSPVVSQPDDPAIVEQALNNNQPERNQYGTAASGFHAYGFQNNDALLACLYLRTVPSDLSAISLRNPARDYAEQSNETENNSICQM